MLTARQVATMLGISSRLVYDLAARGFLVAYRFGRRVVFDEAHIEAFKQSCRTPGTTRNNRVTTVTATSTDGEAALRDAFVRAGALRRKP
jgi:excisionase family DNA binding protein